MPSTDEIKQHNSSLIEAAVKKLPVINYDTASELVPKLLEEKKLILDCSVYTPGSNCPGRYLIYNHLDTNNPFSIWIFAIGPQQETAIHDHQFKGTVTVLEGPVSEKYYKPTDTGNHLVTCVRRADRHSNHTNSDNNLDDGFVHQLKRRKALGDGVSVTLHVYNMKAYVILNGKQADNRNLGTTFFKDKRPGVSHCKEPYEALYNERVGPSI